MEINVVTLHKVVETGSPTKYYSVQLFFGTGSVCVTGNKLTKSARLMKQFFFVSVCMLRNTNQL